MVCCQGEMLVIKPGKIYENLHPTPTCLSDTPSNWNQVLWAAEIRKDIVSGKIENNQFFSYHMTNECYNMNIHKRNAQ